MTVSVDTTDQRALATSSLERTTDGTTSDQPGTLVHIGDGLYLSAGHVMYQYSNPGSVRSAEDYRLTVQDGLNGAYSVTIDDADFASAFHNLGWGTPGGADISAARSSDTAGPKTPMLIYADPNDAQGQLSTFGYPDVDGYDGSTMIHVGGVLSADAHRDIATGNGDMSVLVSDIGMQVRSGQSGSGVWMTADPDGNGISTDYLIGIVTLDIQYVGGLHATGIEPLGDVYSALGVLIEAADLSLKDFARATLVSGQSLDSAHTEVIGTVLNEDLFGGQNVDTLDGGGGKDRLYGGLGDDILIDGAGVDNMTGGDGADTFRLTADSATDVIRDFENGIDLIDVSALGIVSFDQLTTEVWGTGKVLVRGAREKLIIDDGTQTLNLADIDALDFIFAADTVNTITGTDQGEKLYGTINDDAIHDLGGTDALFGRAGADTFVLSADGARDHVKDYQDGIDLLDISAWTGVTYDVLAFKNLNGGKVQITYGNEQLYVMNSTRDLTMSDLTEADFVLL